MSLNKGVYWERKHIDCWDSTNIMCLFAKKLGLESKWTYAGYAQHYYATVTIDGKEYDFDECPMAETGWIDGLRRKYEKIKRLYPKQNSRMMEQSLEMSKVAFLFIKNIFQCV